MNQQAFLPYINRSTKILIGLLPLPTPTTFLNTDVSYLAYDGVTYDLEDFHTILQNTNSFKAALLSNGQEVPIQLVPTNLLYTLVGTPWMMGKGYSNEGQGLDQNALPYMLLTGKMVSIVVPTSRSVSTAGRDPRIIDLRVSLGTSVSGSFFDFNFNDPSLFNKNEYPVSVNLVSSATLPTGLKSFFVVDEGRVQLPGAPSGSSSGFNSLRFVKLSPLALPNGSYSFVLNAVFADNSTETLTLILILE